MGEQMTYRKIAQLAGVSPSTVSKALAGSSEISRETAERILKIAEANGVRRPNYHKSRAHYRVAILIPEIISVYYSQVGTALIGELRRWGIEPYIHLCGFDGESFCRLVSLICEEKLADGILSLATSDYTSLSDIPIVGLGMSQGYPRFDAVASDIQSGLYEAVEYLHSLGHSDIGFISEQNTDSKLRYFRSAMARFGLPIHDEYLYVSRKRFAEIGCEAAEYYIKSASPPTALIAAYDEVALGAIYTFRKNGISVPEDVSVIGINDIPVSSYSSVPLTTIRTFSSEIIERAVKLLLDRIKAPERHIVQHITIKCELIIRDTTAKVKQRCEQTTSE